jgi:hypothetical protein
MTKVHNQNSETLGDVLYQFSLAKEVPDAELLDEYVRLFPDYAEALTDFAVQLVVESKQPKTAEAPVPETKVSPVVSRAMSKFQSALHAAKASRAISPAAEAIITPVANPFAKLDRNEFRRAAGELHANTYFLSMVRDGLVVFATMKPGFLVVLASATKNSLDDVTTYLQARKPIVAAGQFYKTDNKPQAGSQITFEEAVKRSQLTPEQQQFLLNL